MWKSYRTPQHGTKNVKINNRTSQKTEKMSNTDPTIKPEGGDSIARDLQKWFLFTNFCVKCTIAHFNWRKLIKTFSVGIALSTADLGLSLRSSETKHYEIGTCCFSAKHALLRSKSKDCLVWHQDNVSEWSDMSICGLLFQWVKTKLKFQHKHPTKRVGLEYKVDCSVC